MYTTGVMGMVLSGMVTEDSVDVTAVLGDDLGQAKVEVVETGGKTTPFCKGRGKVGLGAVPTTFPFPGKTGPVVVRAAEEAEEDGVAKAAGTAEAAATFAA